ncbi:Spx/MgsR family RNA polymerase-binding regulatory protein [Facklamia sp. 7083-14-GEN3]|uniref:Spx/MgsR family RNA polymerase-binding regulatory protein n=1 Tax=Facklamia sp. 7083-14-GEN3 TaxID=2973478 RepID=UPI00215C5A8F|nr:Spx/MgsR family RNA polymerase-binding regulatory protein [Facklamia sp. 7083-14-GEN3]MCR8968557.1 Spx/MgsR family RNA polymerase-binding regulatory protein [Facklamia sp. 7083-14-GEN3]
MIKVYGLKHCSTCQKIINYMQEQGFELSEIEDIRDNPPSLSELKLAYQSTDGNIRKMLNTSGQLYRDMKLKERLDSMSSEEVLKLMSKNGMLIKRPLLIQKERASSGSNLKIINRVWKIEEA